MTMWGWIRCDIRVTLMAGVLTAMAAPAWAADGELVMKLLVVNPSLTEVKEFDIRSPLPPEIKPEHVLDADGLKVDYDSREGTYMLVGNVTLKPKESLTKRIVLQDVWVVPAERLSSLRRETDEIQAKLASTLYEERGSMLVRAVERRLAEVEEGQDQPFLNPSQHLTRYHDNLKTLDLVDIDMVSLRQLMVMAALNPSVQQQPAVVVVSGDGQASAGTAQKGGLSILATWRLIFIILGLLGFVSISFFLIWQRQLKQQLAKQSADESSDGASAGNGHGSASSTDAEALLRLPPSPTPPAGTTPRHPLP